MKKASELIAGIKSIVKSPEALDMLQELDELLSSNASFQVLATGIITKESVLLSKLDPIEISTDGRNTCFLLPNGSKYIASKMPLSKIEKEWGDRFLRISRSEMIALDEILEFKKIDGQFFIGLKSRNCTIPVSRRQASELRKIWREKNGG